MHRSSAPPLSLIVGLMLLAMPMVHGFRPFDADPLSRVALGGFDPVAYLETGKAVKGAPIFFVEWGGVFWRFTDKANQRKFERNPEQFLPEVGGYCATSFAEDKTVKCDPTEFAIHEGRLFVFGNEKAKEAWMRDPGKFIDKARAAYEARVAAGEESEPASAPEQ